MSERERIHRERERERERERVRWEYGWCLFDRVSEILFEDDPVGINFETNTDEYEPEVETILPRLRECGTTAALQAVVHQEFVRWFGPATAGSPERYSTVAELIWSEWETFNRP